jgi:hypothetical protein
MITKSYGMLRAGFVGRDAGAGQAWRVVSGAAALPAQHRELRERRFALNSVQH